MTGLLSALPPQAVDAAVFAGAVVFSVTTLEGLRARLTRGWDVRRANAAALTLGLVYAAMFAGGAAGLAFYGLAFVPLGLLLTGGVSCGILAETIWRFHRGTLAIDAEMRRVLADDL